MSRQMEAMDQPFSHEGLQVHVLKTDKYKTTTLMLMMQAPLEKETVSKRALLPHVLQGGTKKWPTRQKLRVQLDDLYGARLSGDVRKSGEQHVISFFMDIANERYLKETDSLLKDALEVLSDVVLQPHTEQEAFSSSVVTSEKRTLKQRIESVYDDKMRYANMRATEEMCKGEAYAIPAFGDSKSVDQITPEDLYSYYQQMLQTDLVDLYIVGDVDEKVVTEQVKRLFQIPERNQTNKAAKSESTKVDEVNIVQEAQDIKQGKLNMGFRTHTHYGDEDYAAMQVFNGLYGGFTHSKLFVNVREKESLAYYAASRLESHKGIMMVMAGIEFDKYDRTVEIVKEQFEKTQQGDFSDSDIEQTKSMLRNQLLETSDSASGQIELHYRKVISGADESVDELLEQIEQVSREDIIQAAKKCELDTIYFLKGDINNEPNAV